MMRCIPISIIIVAAFQGLNCRYCQAASTVLRFEVAEKDFDDAKDYTIEELFTARTVRRVPRGTETVYDINPLTKREEFTFAPGQYIHEYFDKTFASKQTELSDEVYQLIASDPRVRTIDYAYVQQKPLTLRLQVDGPRILFQATGLEIRAKADIDVEGGWERLVCGSTVRTRFSANLHAYGEYDLESGQARITNIDPNENVDADCSGLLGKILDFALDRWVDEQVSEDVEELIRPILAETVDAGSLREQIDSEAARAESKLGINFADAAWDGLLTYTDALTLEINIGVDYFGSDQHLFGFRLFSSDGEFQAESSTSRGRKFDTIRCPSWARSLTVYEATLVQTGTRRTGRRSVPVYGARSFKKLEVGSSLTYTRDKGCFGAACRFIRDPADKGIAASCTGNSGLSTVHLVSGIPEDA